MINTAGGSPAYAPSPGTVQFQIQGYDASGNFVVGATDTVTMYIDNTGVDLALASVQMGSQTGGDCALFDLSDEPDPVKEAYCALQGRSGPGISWFVCVDRA